MHLHFVLFPTSNFSFYNFRKKIFSTFSTYLSPLLSSSSFTFKFDFFFYVFSVIWRVYFFFYLCIISIYVFFFSLSCSFFCLSSIYFTYSFVLFPILSSVLSSATKYSPNLIFFLLAHFINVYLSLFSIFYHFSYLFHSVTIFYTSLGAYLFHCTPAFSSHSSFPYIFIFCSPLSAVFLYPYRYCILDPHYFLSVVQKKNSKWKWNQWLPFSAIYFKLEGREAVCCVK